MWPEPWVWRSKERRTGSILRGLEHRFQRLSQGVETLQIESALVARPKLLLIRTKGSRAGLRTGALRFGPQGEKREGIRNRPHALIHGFQIVPGERTGGTEPGGHVREDGLATHLHDGVSLQPLHPCTPFGCGVGELLRERLVPFLDHCAAFPRDVDENATGIHEEIACGLELHGIRIGARAAQGQLHHAGIGHPVGCTFAHLQGLEAMEASLECGLVQSVENGFAFQVAIECPNPGHLLLRDPSCRFPLHPRKALLIRLSVVWNPPAFPSRTGQGIREQSMFYQKHATSSIKFDIRIFTSHPGRRQGKQAGV